jgi:hypothetical protein
MGPHVIGPFVICPLIVDDGPVCHLSVDHGPVYHGSVADRLRGSEIFESWNYFWYSNL